MLAVYQIIAIFLSFSHFCSALDIEDVFVPNQCDRYNNSIIKRS